MTTFFPPKCRILSDDLTNSEKLTWQKQPFPTTAVTFGMILLDLNLIKATHPPTKQYCHKTVQSLFSPKFITMKHNDTTDLGFFVFFVVKCPCRAESVKTYLWKKINLE